MELLSASFARGSPKKGSPDIGVYLRQGAPVEILVRSPVEVRRLLSLQLREAIETAGNDHSDVAVEVEREGANAVVNMTLVERGSEIKGVYFNAGATPHGLLGLEKIQREALLTKTSSTLAGNLNSADGVCLSIHRAENSGA